MIDNASEDTRGAASPRVNYFLLCKRPDMPDPEDIAASLREAGYRAEVTQNGPYRNYELGVDPKGTRVMVHVGGSLHDGWDVNTGDHETLDDLVAEGIISEAERADIYRFVSVGHWDHADPKTVEALLRLLEGRMDGRLVDF